LQKNRHSPHGISIFREIIEENEKDEKIMTKSSCAKKFLKAECVKRLNYFERTLFIGMLVCCSNGKINADAAFLRSAVFPFDDVPLDLIAASAENIRKHLGVKTVSDGSARYFLPTETNFSPQEKKGKTNEEKRKATKEIKKKEKRKEKNYPPRGDEKGRYSVHFSNERKYTKAQLDALITDVDDIDI